MLVKSVRGYTPAWGEDCFIAENATLIGDVVMGDQCSIWYQAVIRGDVHNIRIGDRVNIQDGAVIHATYKKAGTLIGNDVSIGHNAIVHGCTNDNVLIGMEVAMDNCASILIVKLQQEVLPHKVPCRRGGYLCRHTCQK